MATVTVFVLAIILCHFHVRGESVDCELYPFHHTCRGTMSRKRAMFPIIYGSGCDGDKESFNSIKEFEERHYTPYTPLSKSKLLIALLNDDLQKDVTLTRSARRKLRNNNERSERDPPLMESFLSELESSDYY